MNKSFVVTLIIFLFSCSAHAVPFNFQELIDTNNGVISGTLADGSSFSGNPGEAAFQNFSWDVLGIELMVSGSHVSDNTTYAYLDRGRAGLGVCKNYFNDNQCSPSSDDNVTVDETLQLTFNQGVELDFSNTIFRDANHNIFNPSIEINVDANGWGLLNTDLMLTGTSFAFRTPDNSNQFYISVIEASSYLPELVAVSEPMTLILIIFGFGLLVFKFKNKHLSGLIH